MRFSDRVAVLGGADPQNLPEPAHRTRHLFVGTLLLTIAFWAFLSTTETFHSLLPLPAAAVVGVVIAAVILSVDVLITVTPLTDDTTWHRVKVLLVRGMISLAMGLVIGLSTIMYLYQGSITQIMSENNKTIAARDTGAITKGSQWPGVIAQDKGKVADAQARITKDRAEISSAEGHLNDLNQKWLNDQLCVHGNRAADGNLCRSGPVTDQLKQEINSYQQSTLPGIVNTANADIKAASSEIAVLNQEISSANGKLSTQIKEGTKADLSDNDLAAQSEALITLLKRNVLIWVWPIFFFTIDLAVALMKAILPESGFDRRRREARRRDDAISAEIVNSKEWTRVAEHKARREADVLIARIDAEAEREIEALKRSGSTSEPDPTATGTARTWPRRRSRLVWTGGSATIAVLVTLSVTVGLGWSPTAQSQADRAAQTITLKSGEQLTVPAGAISGNAPVKATYTASTAWTGNTAATPEVTFTTTGKLLGKPILSLKVSGSLKEAAAAGALHLAFRSSAPSGWTDYPVTYDAATHSMTARLDHFSSWEFWTWDWAGILADISQNAGQWEGRRATTVPDCSSGPATPSWYNTNAGISNDPGLVVRGCVKGHAGNVLDVELVNNRPYGLMLNYGGAPVQWGWHEDPGSLADALRDAIGDSAARASGGLYMPPLSAASVGIMSMGNGADHVFAITPTPATILADALNMTIGGVVGKATFAGAKKWGSDVFAAAAAGQCSEFLTKYTLAHIPDQSDVMTLLTDAPGCIRNILAVAAHNEISQADGADESTVAALVKLDAAFKQIVATGKWVSVENDAGDVLDLAVDQKYAAVPQLGFGFSILDHYIYQGPSSPAQTQQPTQPTAPGVTPSASGGGRGATASPPIASPTPAPGGQAVTVYDNYGTALRGYPVCRGNPGRPESMPGGTVSQTYTVPSGVRALTQALVQIDHGPVTVNANLSVNGVASAHATATAADDTTFNFGTVPVAPGDLVTLTLTMTATSGKITTVYSAAGTPGTFTITDSCPDGAANVSTSAAGLRSKLFGITG